LIAGNAFANLAHFPFDHQANISCLQAKFVVAQKFRAAIVLQLCAKLQLRAYFALRDP